MSLKAGDALRRGRPLLAMMHFPPLTERDRDTAFTRLFSQYRPDAVAYGHLHGESLRSAFAGEWNGVTYHQVSCDGLGFRLKPILNIR